MMTLAEIAGAACQVLGIDDEATQTQAKAFVRTRWALLWNSQLWPQARTVQSVTLLAAQTEVALAAPMELATLVRREADGAVVPAESEIAALLTDPNAFREQAGVPMFWCAGAPSGGLPTLNFSHAPTSNLALTVLGKAACPALTVDTDKPTIPGADLALIAHVGADLYEWQRQMGKAQAKRQEALALTAQMTDTVCAQAGYVTRLVPYDAADAGEFPWSKG